MDTNPQQKSKEFPIKGCRKLYVMSFSPNASEVYCKPLLCQCQACLDLDIRNCQDGVRRINIENTLGQVKQATAKKEAEKAT